MVAYAVKTGISDGNITYGTPITGVKGRYERIDRVIRTDGGKSVFASHVFDSEVVIPADSRFWPPGVSSADPNLALKVVRVEEADTLDGSYTLIDVFIGTF